MGKAWGFAANGGKLTEDRIAISGGKKPRKFWQSPETIETLQAFVDGKVTEEQAAEKLKVPVRDVKYYVNRHKLTPTADKVEAEPAAV